MTTLFLALLLRHPAPTPVDVLANVRQALAVAGNPAPWAETVLTGKASYHGLDDAYKFAFTGDGRFRQSIEGKLGQITGSNGTSHWLVDHSGCTHPLDFEDVDRVNALMLPITDRWLEPSPAFAISVADRPAKDGNVVVNLKFQPSGFVESIHVDPKTWLPKSADYEISSNKTTILLKDWQPAGSQRVPFTVEITENGLTDTLHSDSAAAQSAPDASMFTMPVGAPTDTTYDASIPATIETRRAETGHILVHPRVEGVDVGWFILDSGAECMIIDTETADAMHLPKLGKESVLGVGGAVQEPFRTAKRFSLGPAAFDNPLFLELDLHQLSGIFKVKLAGIVGYDFFRRFTVGVNLSKPQVSVFDSAKYTLPSGAWSPMKFSTGNPGVEATFEGDHKAWFRIDTGANGTVTFHSPTVDRLGMLKGRDTKPAGMAGVGGTTEAKVGKLAWFELGGHRFEKVEATFSLSKTGAFADRYFAGNIGQDFLEPFDVIFDFGGSRVAFLPN